MKQYKTAGLRLQGWCFLAILLFCFPTPAVPADRPVVLAQGALGAPPATQAAKPLTLDEAVRITLENHSSVKSAQFQIKAQDAEIGRAHV